MSPFTPVDRHIASILQHKTLLGCLLILWMLTEGLRNERLKDPWTSVVSPGRSTLLNAVKLIISSAIYLWRRRDVYLNAYNKLLKVEGQDEELLLDQTGQTSSGPNIPDTTNRQSIRPSLHVWTGRSIACIGAVAALYVLRDHAFSALGRLTDPFAPYLVIPISTLFSTIILAIFFSRNFSALSWHAILLQLCGFFIFRTSFIKNHLSGSLFSALIASALSSSFAFVSNDVIYKSHNTTSIMALNIPLFAFGTVISGFLALLPSSYTSKHTVYPGFLDRLSLVLLLVEAGRDIIAISVIFHFDATFLGVMSALASVIVLLVSAFLSMWPSATFLAGCCAVIIGSATYFSYNRTNAEEAVQSPSKLGRIRRTMGIASFTMLLPFVLYTTIYEGQLYSNDHTPSVLDALVAQSSMSDCQRKPLASLSYPPQPRTYHEFDNVLLIVFFSHARYESIDDYKKVYAEFFPNMIFIGPASREDGGFSQSYDVLVDTYESDEDLKDPMHYKMAGRMAHHMLYTAMRQQNCYDGYLWVPFDTLLNIPRLQQFDQRYFWYHSPWGEFVPNPAFKNAQDTNRSRHAPPAKISPDPQIKLTETWRGVWDDWWWGDPHVGLEVCMRAFRKVPLEMRERMADFTDGNTRLIGGSADTVYIPGRHRQRFMDTLRLFLETDCFLEIATPTAVHLVVPPKEPILFVDHWWIWQPPFNATFVRQKWGEGFEVDTFHTFHWGEKDIDEVWTENPDNIADVRNLLKESAARQKVDLWHNPS